MSTPVQSFRYNLMMGPSDPPKDVSNRYYSRGLEDANSEKFKAKSMTSWKLFADDVKDMLETIQKTHGVEIQYDDKEPQLGFVMLPWTGSIPTPIKIASNVTMATGEPRTFTATFSPDTRQTLPTVPAEVVFPSKLTITDLTDDKPDISLQCKDNSSYGGGYCSAWMMWFALELAQYSADSFWAISAKDRKTVYTDLYKQAERLNSQIVFDRVHTTYNPNHRSQRIIKGKPTNEKKNPFTEEGVKFTKTFKETILKPLEKNGFRIAISGTDVFQAAYDIVEGRGVLKEFKELVDDKATTTPILFFAVITIYDGPHAIAGIYFPTEKHIDLITTYPIGDKKEVFRSIGEVRTKGGRRTRHVRKTRRRRTLRKHK